MNIKTISRIHYHNGMMAELCIIYRESRIPWFKEPNHMDMDKLTDIGVKNIELVLEEVTELKIADGRDSRLVYIGVKDQKGNWLLPRPEDTNMQNQSNDTEHGVQKQPGNEPE